MAGSVGREMLDRTPQRAEQAVPDEVQPSDSVADRDVSLRAADGLARALGVRAAENAGDPRAPARVLR